MSATTTIIDAASLAATEEQRERQQREVDDNYAAFRGMLDGLMADHAGRYALMKDRKVVAIFDTFGDARTAGNMHCSDRVFSIQEITRNVLHLGRWSLF